MEVADWISILVPVVEAAATVALVVFAVVTINEGRKDRHEAAIERRLEMIYFPMFEILDRARNENADRASVRTTPVPRGDSQESGDLWAFVLTPEEFDQVRDMVQRFGYYLEATELNRLRSDLEKASFITISPDLAEDLRESFHERPPPAWVRLNTGVFDNHWRFFNSRCKKLTSELEQLTGIKND